MKKKHFILLLTIILFAIIPVCFNIFWSAADDPRYIFMTSGAYTGTPSGSLMYVGSLYGSFIAFLYSITVNIEWYSLLYYFFFILSIAIITKKILWANIKAEIKYLGLSLILFTHTYMALSPQSTFLAADLSIASMALLYRYKNRINLIYAALVFFIATQFRLFGALMPYFIALPIFFFYKGVSLSNVRKYIVPSCIFILLSAITFGSDYIRYNSTPEWHEFKKFDAARCYIADNPLSYKLSEHISNKEDKLSYDLFQKYRIYDTNIMTVDKMVNYASMMKKYRWKNIQNNIRSYVHFYLSFGFWGVVLLILWGGISLFMSKDNKRLILLLATSALFAFANLFMMGQSEAKERALIGALFSFVFAVIIILGIKFKHYRLCYIIFTLCFCLQFTKHIKQVYQCIPDKMAILEETESILNEVPYQKVYMPVPSCIDPEAFHSSNSPIANKTVIQGWLQIFPEEDLKYRHLTAFSNGLPILVKKEAKKQVQIIKELLDIHYGIKTEIKLLRASKNYELIQLKKI